jgi:hypothetical protein
MNFNIKNNNTGIVFFNRKMLPFFICFLAFFPAPHIFAEGNLTREETENLRHQGFTCNSFDLGREFQILFYDRLHDIVLPSLLRSGSSSPLSSQNYKRIRPRGITGHQPTINSPLLYRQTYYFAPEGSSSFRTHCLFAFSSLSGKRNRIRPPPCMVRG